VNLRRGRWKVAWVRLIYMLYSTRPFQYWLCKQASIGVNVLNEKSSNFVGKITASTGDDKNRIVLFDSEVVGLFCDSSYSGGTTRWKPWNEWLMQLGTSPLPCLWHGRLSGSTSHPIQECHCDFEIIRALDHLFALANEVFYHPFFRSIDNSSVSLLW
jgi:hypothetical protein